MNLAEKQVTMNNPISTRYLTKSRYKIGMECPTKLFYTGKKKEYANSKQSDPFMEALAEGGYQVGELAKRYYPEGQEIEWNDHEDAEAQTNELLKNDRVTIFEAAIRYENLFILIDILVKNGNRFDLIEVKSKSFDTNKTASFFGKKGGLKPDWKPYLEDVAFQNYVLAGKFPEASIKNFLMMADKNAKCATNGLNQKFRITRDANNRKGVAVHNSLSDEDLEHWVLTQVSVDEAVRVIQDNVSETDRSFAEEIRYLSDAYEKDEKIAPRIGRKCKQCEFVCSDAESSNGLKSGFKECWSEALGWEDKDFDNPNLLDIWKLDYRIRDKLFAEGKIKLADITEADLNVKDAGKPGLSRSERQWCQVKKFQDGDTTRHFDAQGFKEEMQSWTFPLHFIDFENATVALPFSKGRKPYEVIAFQFSHHIVHENGDIEHAGQYININQAVFPNIEFLRELKAQLGKDEGTIFRYAPHENTVLNTISRQLEEMVEQESDHDELIEFINGITYLKQNNKVIRKGSRDMIDMLELVKRYYFDPQMKGSNSLKVVLPAILNSSRFLQEKYKHPIYGAESEISSHNFPTGWTWVEIADGIVKDPYKKLPKLFEDVTEAEMDLLSQEDELNNGGAAMTSYAKLQFEEISDDEKESLKNGLLRYCELDTLAMVMVFEAWREWVR